MTAYLREDFGDLLTPPGVRLAQAYLARRRTAVTDAAAVTETLKLLFVDTLLPPDHYQRRARALSNDVYVAQRLSARNPLPTIDALVLLNSHPRPPAPTERAAVLAAGMLSLQREPWCQILIGATLVPGRVADSIAVAHDKNPTLLVLSRGIPYLISLDSGDAEPGNLRATFDAIQEDSRCGADVDREICSLLRNTRTTDRLRHGGVGGFLTRWRLTCAACALLRNTRTTDSLRHGGVGEFLARWRLACAACALLRNSRTTDTLRHGRVGKFLARWCRARAACALLPLFQRAVAQHNLRVEFARKSYSPAYFLKAPETREERKICRLFAKLGACGSTESRSCLFRPTRWNSAIDILTSTLKHPSTIQFCGRPGVTSEVASLFGLHLSIEAEYTDLYFIPNRRIAARLPGLVRRMEVWIERLAANKESKCQ